MTAEHGEIALHVAARGAVYPIVVDPELWAQEGAALARTDAAAADTFGTSVSVSGDSILVGAAVKTIGANASQGGCGCRIGAKGAAGGKGFRSCCCSALGRCGGAGSAPSATKSHVSVKETLVKRRVARYSFRA